MKKLLLLLMIGLAFTACTKDEPDCGCVQTVYKDIVKDNVKQTYIVSQREIPCANEKTVQLSEDEYYKIECN